MSPSEKSVDKASTAKSKPARSPHDEQRNPAWFKPVMFGFMLVGFLWVIVYYISGTTLPVPALGMATGLNWSAGTSFRQCRRQTCTC